jgi:N-dimethylarginine dimethylaminohydrolase
MAEEQVDGQADGQEYEEITSDEVDRVVEQLERLMETVQSENIKSYLEDAISNIFFLVYEDDDSAEAA